MPNKVEIMVRTLFKVILAGEGSVGKTSLRRRFMGDKFQKAYAMTIGADFSVKKMKIEGHEISFSIWDLAGQSHFKAVRPAFYKGAQAAFVVFSTVERASFEAVPNWVNEVWTYTSKDIPMLLVGNKIDLREQFLNRPAFRDTIVLKEEGEAYAKKLSEAAGHEIQYIETSALTGENVNKMFEIMGLEILRANNLI